MSTSGTATFTRNRNQIIKSALRKVSAFEAGEEPDNDSVSDASDALNAMIKHWQGSGIHIWRMAEGSLTLVANQVSYVLGTDPEERPIKIISARLHDATSGIDTPIEEMDRVEYQEMPNKTASGTVSSFFYDRRDGTSSTGLIYLWPAPDNSTDTVKYTYARPIETFTAAGDDADFPEEWSQAIIWNLADQIADDYDVPDPKRGRIEARAAKYLDEVSWQEKELISFQLVPDDAR